MISKGLYLDKSSKRELCKIEIDENEISLITDSHGKWNVRIPFLFQSSSEWENNNIDVEPIFLRARISFFPQSKALNITGARSIFEPKKYSCLDIPLPNGKVKSIGAFRESQIKFTLDIYCLFTVLSYPKYLSHLLPNIYFLARHLSITIEIPETILAQLPQF